jgi:hypothetical protein
VKSFISYQLSILCAQYLVWQCSTVALYWYFGKISLIGVLLGNVVEDFISYSIQNSLLVHPYLAAEILYSQVKSRALS